MNQLPAACAVAIGVLACAGSSPAADAQTLLNEWRQLRQECNVINAQYDVEKEVCREELTAGVARSYWSEDQRKAADDWIVALFAPNTADRNSAAVDRVDHFGTIYLRLRQPRPDLVTYTYQSGWLERRLLALGKFDKTIMGRLASTACDYAEEVWKTAKQPEDLQPAVTVLRETWTLLGMDVLQTIKSTTYEGRTYQVKNFYPLESYYGALGSNHPLFMPAPETDPVAFAKAERDFWALNRSWNGSVNDFATQPSVSEFVRKLEARYRRVRERQWKELDALVQRDASADALSNALDQVPEETAQSEAPKFPAPPSAPRGTPNYHQNIAATPAPWVPPPAASRTPEDARKDKYKLWLKLRRAEEAEDSQAVARVERDLQATIKYLPASMADALSRRLRPAALPAVAPATADTFTNTSAIDQLIRGLGDFPHDHDPLHLAAGHLADILPQLAEHRPSPPSAKQVEPGQFWVLLAAQPDNATWFHLRDRAVRELLQPFATHPVRVEDTSLSAELCARLEAGLEKGDWEHAEQLLAIDEAFMLLPPWERTAYLNDVEGLRRADQVTGGDAQLAAEYRSILTSSHSLGLGLFAVSQMKKYRPTAESHEVPKKVP